MEDENLFRQLSGYDDNLSEELKIALIELFFQRVPL